MSAAKGERNSDPIANLSIKYFHEYQQSGAQKCVSVQRKVVGVKPIV